MAMDIVDDAEPVEIHVPVRMALISTCGRACLTMNGIIVAVEGDRCYDPDVLRHPDAVKMYDNFKMANNFEVFGYHWNNATFHAAMDLIVKKAGGRPAIAPPELNEPPIEKPQLSQESLIEGARSVTMTREDRERQRQNVARGNVAMSQPEPPVGNPAQSPDIIGLGAIETECVVLLDKLISHILPAAVPPSRRTNFRASCASCKPVTSRTPCHSHPTTSNAPLRLRSGFVRTIWREAIKQDERCDMPRKKVPRPRLVTVRTWYGHSCHIEVPAEERCKICGKIKQEKK